jgi:hypothetical protein
MPSTSGTGPKMHSNLHILCLCLCPARLSNQRRSRHSRHSRRRIGRLCILRSRDNHRIRGSHRIHHIRGSHRIRGPAARR